jgi:CRISPR-associated protein Cmr2
VITFAPVQSFISSSRKLRDLYGSSLLLSYLAKAILDHAQQQLGASAVISPALVSTSRGTPNQLVIQGDYRKSHGRDALLQAWAALLDGCRNWLEQALQSEFRFEWQSAWDQLRHHSWEYFHAQGATISEARRRLRELKQARDWQAINWTGESSTLSGSGAACRPLMGTVIDPRQVPPGQIDAECQRFAAALREHPHLGEAFIDPREQLSVPELVKRLVTYAPVARRALAGETLDDLLPERFQEIAASQRVVWFMADGDRIGEHLARLSGGEATREAQALSSFSAAMRHWAQQLYSEVPRLMEQKATVIYAGGDDLLGALHNNDSQQLTSTDLFFWLQNFSNTIWPAHQQAGLTVSMGLVWTEGQVPQREALSQLRQAEQHAKQAGRDRFALRVLFKSGRHLQWICPWRVLPRLLTATAGEPGFWRRLSSDIEQLLARRGLDEATAQTLWVAFFGDRLALPTPNDLGQQELPSWMRDMARVLATLPTA